MFAAVSQSSYRLTARNFPRQESLECPIACLDPGEPHEGSAAFLKMRLPRSRPMTFGIGALFCDKRVAWWTWGATFPCVRQTHDEYECFSQQPDKRISSATERLLSRQSLHASCSIGKAAAVESLRNVIACGRDRMRLLQRLAERHAQGFERSPKMNGSTSATPVIPPNANTPLRPNR